MGEILIPGGAGGISSDDVTVTKADVPKGLYAVTKDSNDEVVAGTMALTGNATTAQVYPGKTFYTTDYKTKLTGTMPTQGGATYTPGTADKTLVSANRYVTGNIVMKGDANLKAANIKKGVKILGVTGSWEGWVPTATDLYLRGNNIAGFTANNSSCTFEAGGIKLTGTNNNGINITSAGNLNYVPYNYLNIQGYFEKRTRIQPLERNVRFHFYTTIFGESPATLISESTVAVPNNNSNFTVSINISNVSISKRASLYLKIKGEYYYDGNDGEYWRSFSSTPWQGYVYRIWFS